MTTKRKKLCWFGGALALIVLVGSIKWQLDRRIERKLREANSPAAILKDAYRSYAEQND